MDALKFVVKTLVIGALLVGLMGCGVVSLLTYQWLAPAPVVEKVSVSAPAASKKKWLQNRLLSLTAKQKVPLKKELKKSASIQKDLMQTAKLFLRERLFMGLHS